MHTVEWFQVLLSNANNSIIINNSIWPIGGIPTGTTTLGQIGPRSNGNEGLLPILQSSSNGASTSFGLVLYTTHSLGTGILSLCRDAVSVFYCPSQMGCAVK